VSEQLRKELNDSSDVARQLLGELAEKRQSLKKMADLPAKNKARRSPPSEAKQ
jgi:hypothetical protein